MPSLPLPLRFRRRGRARLLSAAGVIIAAGALLAATSLASTAQASTRLPVNYDFLAGANFGKGTVAGRIEIDLERFLMSVELFGRRHRPSPWCVSD